MGFMTFDSVAHLAMVLPSCAEKPSDKSQWLGMVWHSACTTHICYGEIGVFFCYNWQYSCRYRPYYTPTVLDNLMF